MGLVDALDRAGVDLAPAVARGLVEALFDFAREHAPAGDVGRFGDRAIERACGWTRAPGALVAMLVATGWLEAHDRHRLVVAKWFDRAPDAVHAELARARGFFADGRAPRVRPLDGAARKEAAAFYAEAAREASSAERSAEDQFAFFFFSSSEGSTQKSEEERPPDRSAEAPRRRVHRAPAPTEAAPLPAGVFEALERATAAAAAYGATWAPIRAGDRLDLAAEAMRTHPDRGLDVLAQCVHGYWAKRGKANGSWDPLDWLKPETVFGPKRAGYLDAYDDAIAAGKSPPFLNAARRTPRAPLADADAARGELARQCDGLRETCLRAWGNELRAERERRIFWERGTSAIESRDRKAFDQVLAELAEDARSIEHHGAAPLAAGA